jgi:hypothetical protein
VGRTGHRRLLHQSEDYGQVISAAPEKHRAKRSLLRAAKSMFLIILEPRSTALCASKEHRAKRSLLRAAYAEVPQFPWCRAPRPFALP